MKRSGRRERKLSIYSVRTNAYVWLHECTYAACLSDVRRRMTYQLDIAFLLTLMTPSVCYEHCRIQSKLTHFFPFPLYFTVKWRGTVYRTWWASRGLTAKTQKQITSLRWLPFLCTHTFFKNFLLENYCSVLSCKDCKNRLMLHFICCCFHYPDAARARHWSCAQHDFEWD